MELWHYDHYEQNEDRRELNDHAVWTAHARDGRTFLACRCNDGACEAVEVGGDLLGAKAKLRELAKDPGEWPSVLLGPQFPDVWESLCVSLGLSRLGDPIVGFQDHDDGFTA